jgi:hypothetical protein
MPTKVKVTGLIVGSVLVIGGTLVLSYKTGEIIGRVGFGLAGKLLEKAAAL